MANRIFPVRHADPRGTQLWHMLSTEEMPWIHPPRFGWNCSFDWRDVNGPHATLTATVEFTGTEADGDYVSTFTDINGDTIATVTTTRTGGDLATFDDIADEHTAAIRDEAALDAYVSNAQGDGSDGFTVSGIQGAVFRIVTTAPGGVTVAEAHSAALDLSSIAADKEFPGNAIRSWCLAEVTTTFGAGRTLTVGDAAQPAGILGSTPISLNDLGRSGSAAACAEYQPRPELTYTPIATVALGDDPVLTQGAVLLEILFLPNLSNTAASEVV